MHTQAEDPAPGQFGDAVDNLNEKATSAKLAQDVPKVEAYINDPDALLWDSSDNEEDSGNDSQLEAQAWDESLARVDDEDWEIAEGGSQTQF